MTPKEIAILTAKSYLGKPYVWGGDDPIDGFDCSGLVIECLKSAGVLPRSGDWTAAGLYEKFRRTTAPGEGFLVFYGDPISHVELCLDETFSIGASGGGSETLTRENAIRQNAYVKIRPIKSRGGIFGYVNPFAM